MVTEYGPTQKYCDKCRVRVKRVEMRNKSYKLDEGKYLHSNLYCKHCYPEARRVAIAAYIDAGRDKPARKILKALAEFNEVKHADQITKQP